MKLYKYLFLFLLTFFFFAFIQDLSSFSDGPPESRTSAPGELNCSNGYCHNSFPANSGPGEVSLSGEVFETGFRAGQTYTIEAKVKQSGQQRFGFMVLAYDSISQVSNGMFEITEPNRTQITENMAGDRKYVAHNPANITADSSTWTFNWTAPTTEAGSEAVSFYAAFVAANNNNNNSGDYVYTTRFDAVLDTTWATSVYQELREDEVEVLFDPLSQQLSVEVQAENTWKQETLIEIINLNGQRMYFSNQKLYPFQAKKISSSTWSSGIYVLKLQQGKRSRVHKFRM